MKIIDAILDFFFPPSCISCRGTLKTDEKTPFCSHCLSLLPTIELDESKIIDDDSIAKCYCLYSYEEFQTKGIIFHTKNIFSKRFGIFISNEMKKSLIKHNLLRQIDLITFCPRKRSSIKEYGFDQSKELARYLSLATSTPYESLILRKGKSKEQKFLKKNERLENVKNIFFYNTKKNIKGKTILLIDDVVTTGATVKACAKILKENNAKAVYVLAIAD